MLIRKVWEKKKDGQLLVTIPKGEDIFEGDYVKIEKVEGE